MNFKIRMDQAFITFSDRDGVHRAERRMRCQSTKTQTKKSRAPRFLAYVKWAFHLK